MNIPLPDKICTNFIEYRTTYQWYIDNYAGNLTNNSGTSSSSGWTWETLEFLRDILGPEVQEGNYLY